MLNWFYTNSFIFVEINVDVENAMHSDLVISHNIRNYKMLTAFDFDIIGLEAFQLLQTDITPESKWSNDHCFSLAFYIHHHYCTSVS